MKTIKHIHIAPALIILLTLPLALFSQGRPYNGPIDVAGDFEAEREGTMNGNRIHLEFTNNTELSNWPDEAASKWPNNNSGYKMVDGIGLLVGARVYIENDMDDTTVDSIVVDDPDIIANNPNLHILHFLQTSYREHMDQSDTSNVEWGFYPVWGYFNETSEHPAMSDDTASWPLEGWPKGGYAKEWPGEWDGRFGRGIQYADLETYFVVNDAQDQEYLGDDDMVKYYPKPGRFIGDEGHAITIQDGAPWGGLGLRVETRGFQWNNPQVRDALFWEYNITNNSIYDLPEVCFGYWVDNAIGGEGPDDDIGFYNDELDLAYSWDKDEEASDGGTPGIMGFAYLESPGLAYDMEDNDDDGLIDEARDNPAGSLIGPTDGIADLAKFLDFYGLVESELKEHWSGDEDQDWTDGVDLNGDGIYQAFEPYGDDVGLDGLGPLDLNYPGPDLDGTEGNHKPDYDEALGCEPNFAETDVSESDMLGLTSFQLFTIVTVPDGPAPPGTKWFNNDDVMWDMVAADTLVKLYDVNANLVELFASGPFPLFAGRTERISMAELHSTDENMMAPDWVAPALYQLKSVVQLIYESDYRFAQPPLMPTLEATVADGKVILTWDDRSDKLTRDPFIGNVNDFEGYKLYKSTDKFFEDAEIITDGYGLPTFKDPIFECDLVDSVFGFAEFGLVNGIAFNLGTETGLKHYYIDEDVQNGRTYYYGLTAYDYGISTSTPGIAPSENNLVVSINEYDEVTGVGSNVQIVTPRATAAGYNEPVVLLDSLQNHILGTGRVTPVVFARDQIEDGHTYEVTFLIDTLVNDRSNPSHYITSGYKVSDITSGSPIVVYSESRFDSSGNSNYSVENLILDEGLNTWTLNPDTLIKTDIFDGLQLQIDQRVTEPEIDDGPHATGWISGSPINHMTVSLTKRESNLFPFDYEIVFTGDSTAYTSQVASSTDVRDENDNGLWFPPKVILDQSFDFYVINTSLVDDDGNHPIMDLVVQDHFGPSWTTDGVFNKFQDKILVGSVDTSAKWLGTAFVIDFIGGGDFDYPSVGDRYQLSFERPFWGSDTIRFTTKTIDEIDMVREAQTMDSIKVVPNPYVGTNAMEPALRNRFLNQPRKIMFTHLPASCVIKIFTSSGVLIKTIEVENSAANGSMHWNLLTEENLEIAAGMYIYHVESNESGREHIGKFAVLK